MSDKFYKLPKEFTARKDLKSSRKIVFAYLLDCQGESGFCWPGIQTIMNKTGLSRQTVISSIQRLESVGLLEVKRRGKGKSNHYKTSLKIRPVQKLDQSKNETTGGLKIRPEVVQKLDSNQTDLLNRPNNITSELSELLLNLILQRKPDFRDGQSNRKKKTIERWSKNIDRMIQLDDRKPERIAEVIRWCQADSGNGNNWRGWQNNILSTANLREKFDRIEFDMSKKHKETVSELAARMEKEGKL